MEEKDLNLTEEKTEEFSLEIVEEPEKSEESDKIEESVEVFAKSQEEEPEKEDAVSEEPVTQLSKKEKKPLNMKKLFKRIGFSMLGVLGAALVAFGIIAIYRHQFGINATDEDVELSWADQYGEMTLYADSYTQIKNLYVRVTFRNSNDLLKTISMEKYFSEITPETELSETLCQTAQIAKALECSTEDIYVQTEVISGKIRNDVNRADYGKKISDECNFTFKIRYHQASGKYLVVATVKNNSERTVTSIRNLAASVDFGEHGVLELYPCTLSFATPKSEIPAGSVSSEFLIYRTESILDLPIGGAGVSELISENYILHSYAVSN